MRVLQVQLEIGADPAEVGRARRWASSELAGSNVGGDEALAETLLLLVSELVTNAVVHAGTPSVLRLSLPGRHGPGAVRLEVADMSRCPPRKRHADGDATDGRGLELVSVLADRWGWQCEGLGKRIWCELDRHGSGQGCRGSLSAVSGAAVSGAAVSGAALSGPALSAPALSGVHARQLTAGAVGDPDGVLPA